jgi:2,3-bisphosphoglycerate-independent phosphoglycerate mutase
MDGVGIAPDTGANAVRLARTPNLDRLMANYPMVALKAHGTAVGLPSDDDMGNSEVGHNALGSGQVFAQGAKLVSASIESGKMFTSDTWKALIDGDPGRRMFRDTEANSVHYTALPDKIPHLVCDPDQFKFPVRTDRFFF